MKIDGVPYRSVWVDQEDRWSVRIFDQTRLPWAVEILRLTDEDPFEAGDASIDVAQFDAQRLDRLGQALDLFGHQQDLLDAVEDAIKRGHARAGAFAAA